ncbi:AcrR family transcriptional regulator [Thermocatellispora tengchongensis]|uniref:AcrR family transcriptional regulator n=1 Tax=Thermocatellispora tengchongensis TaxID=1073253 RepID=A0A840PKT0_9ACTN|nr:TetR/AcrR family transcriptional regulator [Thermocatellispora tengchongensis]MBB5138543.1 AcrR family transcriptional regulator [Thermocatellispora tengchongensis]
MSPESQAAPRRRGRPGKRQEIIEAAKRVFLRHGYTDANLDVIAAEAGVSKQTIYNNFAGKQQLFTAVVQAVQHAVTAGSADVFAGRLTATGDLEHDLRTTFRLMARLNRQGDVAAVRRLVITEQMRHPELLAEWTQVRSPFELSLAREIERQAATGVLDVADPALAAHQLVVLTLNDALDRSRFGLRELPDDELDAIVDAGIDLWLRAYRRRP